MEKKALTWRKIATEVLALDTLMDSCIDEETGEIHDAEILQELEDTLKIALQEKAGSIVDYLHFQDDELDSITKEIERLSNIKKVMQKKNANFKEYVRLNMIKMGIPKIETPKGNLSLRKSTVCTIDDESKIPSEFLKTSITYKPDKTAIKKELQQGNEVTGARLEDKQNLLIK